MTKMELIDAIAKNGNMTKKDATNALDTVVKTIITAMEQNDPVKLSGFGTFSTVKKGATEARNPRTGEKIKVPAKTVPKFTFSSTLKKAFAE